MCTKEIADEAKKCPYCRSDQTFFERHKSGVLLSLFAVLLLFAFSPEIRYYFSNVDSTPYLDDISISDSSIRFKTDNYGVYAVVIGNLTNNTPYTWKGVSFELSLYNANDELMDTMQLRDYGVFSAGKSLKFRLQTPVDIKENEYDHFKLKLIAATTQ
ncbi:MAG: hypothetical protein H6854_03170 [Rhodospirillales bacterium]|nr:hypothetical protein [Rhodospirillales bacterium]